MSNTIQIFTNQAADQVSAAFTINRPLSKGFADTNASSYLEIYGGLGGGALLLKKQCVDGVIRELEEETAQIAAEFPAAGKALLFSVNYKSNEVFQVELVGAAGATLSVNAINFKFD